MRSKGSKGKAGTKQPLAPMPLPSPHLGGGMHIVPEEVRAGVGADGDQFGVGGGAVVVGRAGCADEWRNPVVWCGVDGETRGMQG